MEDLTGLLDAGSDIESFMDYSHLILLVIPFGRIFVPDTLDFVIWVNVEDHLKVVVIDPSGGFKKCYRRMIKRRLGRL